MCLGCFVSDWARRDVRLLERTPDSLFFDMRLNYSHQQTQHVDTRHAGKRVRVVSILVRTAGTDKVCYSKQVAHGNVDSRVTFNLPDLVHDAEAQEKEWH